MTHCDWMKIYEEIRKIKYKKKKTEKLTDKLEFNGYNSSLNS